MKKRAYRSVSVKDVQQSELSGAVGEGRVAVGIDVAKELFYATLMDEQRAVIRIVRWRHPDETLVFVRLLEQLPASLEVAMEPSGSYGDAVREVLRRCGFPIYLVSPKRVHDSAEVLDGVPSLHDAKAGTLIARLHLDGLSRRVEPRSEAERSLAAAIRTMDMFHDQVLANVNRLEAMLATYWPELGKLLELDSASLLALVSRFGGPGDTSAHLEEAEKVLRSASRGTLRSDKIAQVLNSAQRTLGVVPVAAEAAALRALAQDTRRARDAYRKAKVTVERLGQDHEPCRALSSACGKVTAAVLIADLGDPRDYPAPAVYVKAAGLNLKVRSSGKHKGKLKITKRGSGRVRKYLYLAALRLIQHDPVIRAWYARKVARDGGVKMRALIAIMRKYLAAMWHVGRGEVFDSTKLYDICHLKLAA